MSESKKSERKRGMGVGVGKQLHYDKFPIIEVV